MTYGPSGSDIAGRSPMMVTAPLGNAQYYAVVADLLGNGTVTVEILVNGKVISTGTAAGGYNIARAQISQGPTVGEWVSDV